MWFWNLGFLEILEIFGFELIDIFSDGLSKSFLELKEIVKWIY